MLLLALGGIATVAAESPVGRPAIQRFRPDIDVYPRNFSVVQGPSGVVYSGSADGVLSFDGTEWRKHETNAQGLARSMAHDGQRRLYIGGYNGFGYFETPIGPGSEYVDLTAGFGIEEPDFADIWQVVAGPEGVFFLALNTLFRFDPDTGQTRVWHHDGRFGAMARIDGRFLVQFRGEGLRVWRDGELHPLAGSESLSAQLYNLVELPGGGFLANGRDGRWRTWVDGRAGEFDSPEGLPESSYFTAVEALDNGLIALGSIDGWLYFLDPSAGTYESFQLAHDWIADLDESAEGGLIAQGDHELMYVRWPAKWTAWSHDHGLTGQVLEILSWQDRWLVISNGGALISRDEGPARFEPLPWTEFEAWDFQPLGDGTGLLAESYTLRHVDAQGVIAEIEGIPYPRVIVPSRFVPGRFHVGTEQGLAIVRRGPDGFRVEHAPTPDGPVVFSILELSANRLMLGTQGRGVLEASLPPDGGAPDLQRIDAQIEYPESVYADLVRLDGAIHALTEDGAWRYEDGRFQRADLYGLDALRRPGRFMDVRQGPDGGLWAFDFNRLLRFEAGRGWEEMEVGPLYQGALSAINFDPSGRVLVGASGGVLIFDPGAPELPGKGFDAMLRSVRLRAGDEPPRQLAPDREHAIPAGPLSIRFDYTLPGLNNRDAVAYQARLTGYEPDFTDWEPTSHYTYFNLEPGAYRFEARARDPSGRVSEIEPFRFEVVPPWYRQPWLVNLRWVGLALLLAFLIWLLMRARMWRLENERQRLSAKVVERTRALVEANRKLKRMAEIDDLTGIANRRSFDQYLRQQLVACHSQERPLSLVLIDLDKFKPYNDRHGHLAGDRVLRGVAQCLTEGFGNDEVLVARFGGDEFVVVLPGADLERAQALAEHAREHCARACNQVELSMGIAAARAGDEVDAVTLLEAADHQLYRMKRTGRNGISAAWAGPKSGGN